MTATLADAYGPDRPLVLVGAGRMGSALLSGWIDGGLPAGAIRVIDPAPSADSVAHLARLGLSATGQVPGGVTAGTVLLAVKPQAMAGVLPGLRSLLGPGCFALSIAAGTTVASIEAGLGCPVVRAMPNTPAQIGRGISAAVAGAGIDGRQREIATALLAAVGAVEWIEDEALIDAVTAVSGSGPAYVFLLAEVLAEAGVAAGLSRDLAERLARATVAGSGALLDASDTPPAALRAAVTSPGGTTAAALSVLMDEEDGLSPLMVRAVLAALLRARELARR